MLTAEILFSNKWIGLLHHIKHYIKRYRFINEIFVHVVYILGRYMDWFITSYLI